MTSFTFWGSINTLFIMVSLLGIYSQLRRVWDRKHHPDTKNKSTELLSINQFMVSFLAYYAFFIYGYSITPFNHFIVWPRLIATMLVVCILYELWQDRRNRVSCFCLWSAFVLLITGVLGLLLDLGFEDKGKVGATTLIIIVSVFITRLLSSNKINLAIG